MKTKSSQFGTITVLVALLLVAFQNCGSSEDSGMGSRKPDGGQEIESNLKALEDLAASDLSCSSAADCVAVPVGHRPCGGPSDYLIASFRNSQFDQIELLAEQLTEAQRQYNISNQLAGTCDFRMAPALFCSQLKCVTEAITEI